MKGKKKAQVLGLILVALGFGVMSYTSYNNIFWILCVYAIGFGTALFVKPNIDSLLGKE